MNDIASNSNEIYREIVPFTLGWVVFFIMAIISATMILLFAVQFINGPIGSKPAPDWGYIIGFILFGIMALLMLNFRSLALVISGQELTIGYGYFKKHVLLNNIESASIDQTSNWQYGGYGIRFGIINGKSRLIYNVVGTPKLVVVLKAGTTKELVFSTRNPHQVLEVINRQTGLDKHYVTF